MDMSIFEDSAPAATSRHEVLELTQEAWCDVPDGEQAYLKTKAGMSSGIESVGALRKRVAEFVQVCSLDNTPVRLVTLNRRFARAASKLQTNVADLLSQLLLAGIVCSLDARGQRALFSKAVWDEKVAFRAANGVTGNLLGELMENAQ